MIHKMANFRVKSDRLEICKSAIARFIKAVRENEPNTLFYAGFQEPDQYSFVHLMTFKDVAAEKHHRGTPYVREFVEALYPNCEVEPSFKDLTLVESNQLFRS